MTSPGTPTRSYFYPEVYKLHGNGPPYYKIGDKKFQFDTEMGTLLDSCQKLQTNLTLYHLCKQIKNGADVNCCDGGWSPLDVAYYHKNFTTLRVLLANCALVCNLASPLHLAIAAGCTKEVEQYLCKELGFDVSKLPSLIGDRNIVDHSPCVEKTPPVSNITTPTSEDGQIGNGSCEDGQNISDYIFHYTPEMRTKVEANIEFMLHDLKYFDLDTKDCNTETPLHVACLKGNVYLMELLIKCGADLNMCNAKGYSPLLFACNSCNVDAVDLIIKLGCRVSQFCKGDDGRVRGPLLHAAIGIGKSSIGVIRKLLENGLDVHTRDSNGRTALHAAALCGASDLVKVLLDFKAHPNVVESMTSATPLILACNHHHYEVVKLLLESGADPDAKDRYNESPLVIMLKNVDQFKNVNPFNLYFSNRSYTTQRLMLTVQHLVNYGCRLSFLYNDELVLQTYKNTKDIIHYLFSAACGVYGRPEKPCPALISKILKEDDFETVLVLRMAGYDMNDFHENITSAILTALSEPLGLKALCRITIRTCMGEQMPAVEEPTSKLKTFFRKLSPNMPKPIIPRAISESEFNLLPLPSVLKAYLAFQDIVDTVFQLEKPQLESPAAQLYDQATSLNSDRRRFEKMLLGEAMKELGQESPQETQEKILKLIGKNH